MQSEMHDTAVESILHEAVAACPTLEEIGAYVMGESPAGQRLLIERHLEPGRCARCSEMVDAMRSAARVATDEMAQAPATAAAPRGRRITLAYAASLGALIVVIVIAARFSAMYGRAPSASAESPYVPVEHRQSLGPGDEDRAVVTMHQPEPTDDGKWLLRWDRVRGASSYTVRIYTADRALLSSRHTDRQWLVVDPPQTPGQALRWDVEAVFGPGRRPEAP